MKRGAIDFDFQESKIIVDENGKPIDIVKRERSIAEMIIEEFMLAANETVAEHFHWLRVPFLYRIHENPNEEKLLHFVQFAANFGYVVKGKGNSVHPRALQDLLEQIKDTKEETVISTMMLRSMKQAKYDSESLGHFGLAAEFYSHFTSPIRRYPDLVIHRVIREVIESGGALPAQRHDYLASRMPEIALHSSERERVAVEAERDTEQLKKCEFMLDKVGEEFDGIISSVTSFGMFVELENTVEGLIRLSDLTDDYYHFHEVHMALVGERTSKIYRIGDEVKVRVERVNMAEHTIDFGMVDMKPRKAGGFIQGGAGGGRGRKEGRPGGRAGRGQRERAGGETGGGRKKRGGGAAAGETAAAAAPASGAAPAPAAKRRGGGAPAGGPAGGGRHAGNGGRHAGGGGGRRRGAIDTAAPDIAGGVASGPRLPKAKGGIRTDMWGLPVTGTGNFDGGEEEDTRPRRKRGNGGGGSAGEAGVPVSVGVVGAGSGSGSGGARKSRKKKGGGNATAAFVRKKRR